MMIANLADDDYMATKRAEKHSGQKKEGTCQLVNDSPASPGLRGSLRLRVPAGARVFSWVIVSHERGLQLRKARMSLFGNLTECANILDDLINPFTTQLIRIRRHIATPITY